MGRHFLLLVLPAGLMQNEVRRDRLWVLRVFPGQMHLQSPFTYMVTDSRGLLVVGSSIGLVGSILDRTMVLKACFLLFFALTPDN
jgi:hypothetical protein